MPSVFSAVYMAISLHFITKLVKKTAFSYRKKAFVLPTKGTFVCIGFNELKTDTHFYVPIIEVENGPREDLDALDFELKKNGLFNPRASRGKYECLGAYYRTVPTTDKIMASCPGWSTYELEQMCRCLEPKVKTVRTLF